MVWTSRGDDEEPNQVEIQATRSPGQKHHARTNPGHAGERRPRDHEGTAEEGLAVSEEEPQGVIPPAGRTREGRI